MEDNPKVFLWAEKPVLVAAETSQLILDLLFCDTIPGQREFRMLCTSQEKNEIQQTKIG